MYIKQCLLLIWLVSGTYLGSFAQSSCFDQHFSAGERYERNRNYDEAYKEYNAAARCPGISSAQERKALDALKNAHDEQLKVATSARRDERAARIRAENERAQADAARQAAVEASQKLEEQKEILRRQLIISRATEYAALADRELDSGNSQDGFALAYLAYNKVEKSPRRSVKRSFGKAVRINFQDSLGEMNSPSINTAISPDGAYAMTLTRNNAVNLWQIGQDQPLTQLSGHRGPVSSMVFSPDGQSMVTTSADSTVRLWTDRGRMIAELKGHSGEVSGAVYSSDGSQVLTWSRDRTAKLWGRDSQLRATLARHQSPILSAAFSPDGATILTRDGDGLVMIWDNRGRPISTQGIRQQGHIYSAKISPDSKTVLVGSATGGGLWSLNGQQIVSFSDHSGAITAVDFSSDGQYMLSAGSDGWLRIRDTRGVTIANVQAHDTWVTDAGFSPDGKRIFTLSKKREIGLWDLKAQFLAALGHSDDIISAAFLPDNRYLISSSRDGSARLWDMKGDLILDYKGAPGQLVMAKYSANEGHLLFATQQEPPVFCPNPYAIYTSMKASPPALSEEIKKIHGIDEGEFTDEVLEETDIAMPPIAQGAFSVQLGSFTKDLSSFDMTKASRLGQVQPSQKGNRKLVSIVGIATRPEAERIRDQAEFMGFRGAFIVEVDEKMIAEETKPPSNPLKIDEGFVEPEFGVKDGEIELVPPRKPNFGPFKIQLIALQYPENFKAFEVEHLGPIESRLDEKSKLTLKLLVGMSTEAEARKILSRVKRMAGFKDAFIVKEENGKLIRVR